VRNPEHLDMGSVLRSLVAMTATAFLIFCILAQDAHAQGMGGGRRRQQDTQNTKQDKPDKADEKAYQDALKRIPEKKVDPWGTMR
jgi:hypothetical protein